MEAGSNHHPRVIAYIDGFNLFYGLKDSGWRRYYWLDVCKLTSLLVPGNCEVVNTKYFTSRVAFPSGSSERQSDYLRALETLTGCRIFYGKYLMVSHHCSNCFHEDRNPNEKMTDVNIAVEMMTDAFQDKFDIALLISGDSDLVPPVTAIRRLFPDKRVISAFPPKRHSKELVQVASAHFMIARTRFRDSQLPEEIVKPDGFALVRPERWR